MTGEGAYTGEVSCDHLKDYRIENVLIGHNERRKLYSEMQAVINDKIHQAQDCDINIIYCVGETTEQKESEQTEAVISEQLTALKEVDVDWTKTVIVYEPLWAMGTSIIASAD